MTATAGLFYAAALLLGGAGVSKILRPDAANRALVAARLAGTNSRRRQLGRVAGAAETAVACAALIFGNGWAALALAVSYAATAAVAVRLLRTGPSAPCGCFGDSAAPINIGHVVANVGGFAIAISSVFNAPGSVAHAPFREPGWGISFLIATVCLAWLAYLAITAWPELAATMAEPSGSSKQ
ncbi:MAG: hypothetical protein JWL70_1314 [Acidimicrobiia bacterium]|nr:hypothetical protein [Acidimicrobiia bacterium]